NSSPSIISRKKYFSKYVAGFAINWNMDFTSVIRMEKEVEVSDGIRKVIKNNYDVGTYTPAVGYWNGTFRLASQIVSDRNMNLSSQDSLIKTTTYEYQHSSINFNTNHPYFTKDIVTYERAID